MYSNGIKPKIKVTKNGSYNVTGNILLIKMRIVADEQGQPYKWQEEEEYPPRKTYSLCRCGKSDTKPYCDGKHTSNGFDGTETAGYDKFMDNVKIYDGPELKLFDNEPLCVSSGFCTRDEGIWNLTTHSDNPEYKAIAIEEMGDCPSGRLVLWDKYGILIEPDFELTNVITEDQHGVLGPLWVRGGISVESAEGVEYEIRNRVTLCTCGGSANKPFCDGYHRARNSHGDRIMR